jgi:hypothetical protein
VPAVPAVLRPIVPVDVIVPPVNGVAATIDVTDPLATAAIVMLPEAFVMAMPDPAVSVLSV